MTNKIGEKIKYLRIKSNITQGKLADYLGISFQSVSRWESCLCYPDLEILPAIANYFNVTTDELLGVDNLNKQGRIDEINKKVQANFSKGLVDENITILRAAINEFPNDFSLLSNLAFYISVIGLRRDNPEAAKESISIYERIWKDCTDNKIRYAIIQHLAYLYKNTGEKEKAISLANELPYISRLELIGQIYDGEEKIAHLKSEIMADCERLARNIKVFSWAKYKDDSDMRDLQNVIKLIKKAINIYEIIYENGDYGFYNERMWELYADNAINYMFLQEFDNAIDCLGKAADYAAAFDTLPEPFIHTSIIFEGYEHSQSHTSKDTKANSSYKFLHDYLFHRRYDSIRETERFKAVVARVEKYAKEET